MQLGLGNTRSSSTKNLNMRSRRLRMLTHTNAAEIGLI